MTAVLLSGTLTWFGAAPVALAHGMKAELKESTAAVVVACVYSSGDPADAEVLVYSPVEQGRIFQRLRTDIRGLASFVPDSPGTWRVVADDGMGHRTELELEVGDGEVSVTATGSSSWSAALAALALVAVMALAWWIPRKTGRHRPEVR